MYVKVFLAFSFICSSCHHVPRMHLTPWDQLSPSEQRERLVRDAQELRWSKRFMVGHRKFPFDCSGFVGVLLYRNGIDVYRGASELDIAGNGVKILFEHVAKYGRLFDKRTPRDGDLVFFSNTLDRNRDGKPNDTLTHVGIVERLRSDGTVLFLHASGNRIRRGAMNLSTPSTHRDPQQRLLNTFLRRRRLSDAAGTFYLAGELFAQFGSLVKDHDDPNLQEN